MLSLGNKSVYMKNCQCFSMRMILSCSPLGWYNLWTKGDYNSSRSINKYVLEVQLIFSSKCWGFIPGFDVRAFIPQRLSRSPEYFEFVNKVLNLIICESLKETGGMTSYTAYTIMNSLNLKVVWVREKKKNPPIIFGQKQNTTFFPLF